MARNRRKQAAPAQPEPKTSQRSAAEQAKPAQQRPKGAQQSFSKQRSRRERERSRQIWIGAGLGGLVLLALIGFVLWRNTNQSSSEAATTFQVGNVDSCRRTPQFAAGLGFGSAVSVSTSDAQRKGLLLFDAEKSYQHPSWREAGSLGPFAIDRDGNIYTAPVPRVSPSDIAPNSQRTIYKVDTQSGLMAPFLTLDGPDSTPVNPFGILGLTYDCDTHSLYATSVAGSDREQERGQIVRIDLATQTVVPQLTGVDAVGVGVVNRPEGKTLFFGTARASDVYSVLLDERGDLKGTPQWLFSFSELDVYGNARVRRFAFSGADSFQILTVPFGFNLRASSDRLQQTFLYRYDAASATWLYQKPLPNER